MVKRIRPVLISGALLGLLCVGPAAADVAQAPAGVSGAEMVTVGDFLLRYAQAMNLPLPVTAGPEEAAAELQELGIVEADENLERPLTEGDVVRFASRLGIRLTTLDADRLFPGSKVEPFFNAFELDRTGTGFTGATLPSLTTDGEGCDPNQGNCGEGSPRAREKRKKKKIFESPPEP